MGNALVRLNLISCFCFCLLIQSCGGDPFWLPRAHKITIQQGNLLTERQLNEVNVGMNRAAVRALLGSPVTDTPFHDNRWEYVYTRVPAGSAVEARRVIIFFENELVTEIDSNASDTSGELPEHRNWWETLFPPARRSSL